MQMKKVILVFKTHFDIGFTQLSRDILEYYKGEMLDRVADTCNGTRDMGDLRYVWTMPSWPLATMRDGVDGARAAMLDDLIARGQVTWHALPYASHYDFSGVEDAVWGLRYAKELSERYHVPLKNAAKMTDVPGYGRFLPELLADAGIRFLHLGCNDFAMPPKVPEIFWWEAPSGKRVLTMYNSGYGTAALPPEKRQRIIRAGFRVFSENSYRKSPMSEIAAEAGISKSLLFHYFRNKKELYLFLVNEAVRIAEVEMAHIRPEEIGDLFEIFRQGMMAKLKITLEHPHLTAFIVKAYYEQDPEIAAEVAKISREMTFDKFGSIVDSLNPDDFIPGLDLRMMYTEMYWAGDGCLRALTQAGPLDAAVMEATFTRLMEFWKSAYLRKDRP